MMPNGSFAHGFFLEENLPSRRRVIVTTLAGFGGRPFTIPSTMGDDLLGLGIIADLNGARILLSNLKIGGFHIGLAGPSIL